MDENDLELRKFLIKQQACFAPFTGEETEKLASLLIKKKFQTGEIIVTEGEPVDSVYLIVKGEAEVRQAYLNEGKIETKIIATIGEGESIGLNESGFYSLTGRRTATVTALTDVVVFKLNIAEFHGFALSHSHVSEVMRKNAESINGSAS